MGDELEAAISSGHHERVVSLLDASPSLATTVLGTQTPLHVAAACGHVKMVQLLLDRGASVNVRNGAGRTVLHDCFEYGHDEIVAKCLLPREDLELDVIALVCGSSKFGAPLYDAAGINAADKLATAIKAGTVDVNDKTTGLTPLGWASYGDNVLAAELLCGAGAKLTVDCLHNAASCGHANIIRYLVDKHGADPNARERPDGPTPLHQAALQRFTDDASLAVQVLLERGANPLALDDKGRTPRQVALETRPPGTEKDQSERAAIAGSSSQGDECPEADPQAVARVLGTWEASVSTSSM